MINPLSVASGGLIKLSSSSEGTIYADMYELSISSRINVSYNNSKLKLQIDDKRLNLKLIERVTLNAD